MKMHRRTAPLFLVLFLTLCPGCTSAYGRSSLQTGSQVSASTFLSPAPDLESPAFHREGVPTEQDKIRYLLERIASSKNRFVRNDETRDGRAARQWLLYKMADWVKGVKTAREFIDRVATYSLKTGKPYLVITPEGKTYPLRNILQNELNTFEARFREGN